MKKLVIIFIVPLLLSCVSKGDVAKPNDTYPITVNIRIYGSDSLFFSGEYGNHSDTMQVNGNVPPGNENYVEYLSSIVDSSDMVFADFKKEQDEGELKVCIYVEEHLKTWDATYESYGSVYVTWKP